MARLSKRNKCNIILTIFKINTVLRVALSVYWLGVSEILSNLLSWVKKQHYANSTLFCINECFRCIRISLTINCFEGLMCL